MKAIQVSPPALSRRFPALPLIDHLWFGFFAWVSALVLTFIVTLVLSSRVELVSGWEIASGAALWFVAFMSGYVMFEFMPMFVANGRTRQQCLKNWFVYVPVYAAWGTLLVTIGYLLEYVYYGVAGWSRVIDSDHLFSSHTDVGPMLGEYLISLLVWAGVGGCIGAAIYRWKNVGWLSILPGVVLVGAVGSFSKSSLGPAGFLTHRFPDLAVSSWPLVILVGTLCLAMAMAGTWLIFRDTPLRNT